MWVMVAATAWAGWIRTEIIFGRDIGATGLRVDDEDWQRFLDEAVIPRFPAGFTVTDGTGHWKGETGPRDEDSIVLLVVHPKKHALDVALDEIRAAYIARFHQESVLRIDCNAKVSF
jgi:hypothetical protein